MCIVVYCQPVYVDTHPSTQLVSDLLHFTEIAVNVFKRDQQWREVVKAGGGQPVPLNVLEALNSPVVLPSLFLRHMARGLADTAVHFGRAASELQAALHTRGFHSAASGVTPPQRLASSVQNMHDAFVATAAMAEALHARVEQLRAAYLAKQRKVCAFIVVFVVATCNCVLQAGVYDDPFEEAARQQRMHEGDSSAGRGGVQVHPALQAAVAQPAAAQPAPAFGGASAALSPAASPGVL